MTGFSSSGKSLIVAGIFLMVFGLLFTFWAKIPFVGRLPGDIAIQKGSFRFFFPLVTSIAISVILSLVLNLFFRVLR